MSEFNKVELAKMIGLTSHTGVEVEDWEVSNMRQDDIDIVMDFVGGIKVIFSRSDWDNSIINYADNERMAKQITDYMWQCAADEYLSRVHNAAMLIGNG